MVSSGGFFLKKTSKGITGDINEESRVVDPVLVMDLDPTFSLFRDPDSALNLL